MILVMAGTSDGKALAAALKGRGLPVLVTVTSAYGETLALEEGLDVHTGPLDEAGLLKLIAEARVRLIVDATHPYAVAASLTAMAAAEQAGIPCLRYERPVSDADAPYVRAFSTLEALCDAVENAPGNILLTLGSNLLEPFSRLRNKDALFIRLLPVPGLLEKCLGYGFRSGQLLAMQGPFSTAFNEALIRQWDISVLVTKDSAGPGGFSEKLEAVRNTGISLFLLNRPEIRYKEVYHSMDELLEKVAARAI